MIGFIRNANPVILFFLTILFIMFVFEPGDTVQLLVGLLRDFFALVAELLTLFVELITLSSTS